ncbi:hypothetical protein [Sphingomonas sp. MA1305]|uniref:hypothetical protein n=1 Tax=Sphingomonas sp. MA1305 TaxID=2479204 RepID=UPI0018DFF06D|nr:hypothetical protein [Sphingomonas sp. MA1305]
MISWATTDPAILIMWTDKQLLDAYQRTSGEAGDPEVEALLAEMQRRDLDI